MRYPGPARIGRSWDIFLGDTLQFHSELTPTKTLSGNQTWQWEIAYKWSFLWENHLYVNKWFMFHIIQQTWVVFTRMSHCLAVIKHALLDTDICFSGRHYRVSQQNQSWALVFLVWRVPLKQHIISFWDQSVPGLTCDLVGMFPAISCFQSVSQFLYGPVSQKFHLHSSLIYHAHTIVACFPSCWVETILFVLV
jgi:hypothetical protein